MDKLIAETQRLASELRDGDPRPDSPERYLLNAIEPFLRTLKTDGRPQRGSTEALGRFCLDSLDWSSPLYSRCVAIVERARSRL